MKKTFTAAAAIVLAAGMAASMSACGGQGGTLKAAVEHKIADDGVAVIVKSDTELENVTLDGLFNLYINGAAIGSITRAVGREAGSGTRSCFHEVVKSSDGTTIAKALESGKQLAANVVSETSSSGALISEVAASSVKLGYVSLGSIASHSEIKAVQLEGVEATVDNVKNGSYKLVRPFNLVYVEEDFQNNDLAQNFVSFIESAAGQKIISDEGYVTLSNLTVKEYKPYTGTRTVLKIGGSTSVDPLMKKLIQAYKKINSVDIQETANGSGEGITGARNGTYDIGMSSRALKAEEKQAE